MKGGQSLIIDRFKQKSRIRAPFEKRPNTPCEVCNYQKHFYDTMGMCHRCVVGLNIKFWGVPSIVDKYESIVKAVYEK